MHRGFAALAIKTRLGIVDALASEDNLFLDQYRLAIALVIQLGAEGQLAGLGLLQRSRIHLLFLDHAHFEGRGTAEDVLGLGGVLHARQLHDHAVGALLLDNRLGNTEFINAVAQRGDVLLQREFLGLALGLNAQRTVDAEFAAFFAGLQLQVGHVLGNARQCFFAQRGFAKAHGDRLAFACESGILQALLAQHAADVVGVGVEFFRQRRLHIDLHQEMHAAAQIETEVHRQRAN